LRNRPFQKVDAARLAAFAPKAVILSGGPASVTEDESPRAAPEVFALGVPVLGICYGQQTMVAQLGGTVEGGHHREFGRAELSVAAPRPCSRAGRFRAPASRFGCRMATA
jgi:GMP synthase (glutamine-hydrolysing)